MTSGLKPLTGGLPGESAGLEKALMALLRHEELRSDQLLPAIVISYDRTKNIATVKPLIVWLNMKDQSVSRDTIAQVPVLSLGGGSFHINFPLTPGSLGWIFAADRDLSLFKQTLSESAPNTGRYHSFADSMFVPDVFYKYTINAEDSAAMVIQSTDGATRISIRSDNIKITAPVKVLVDVPLAEFTHDVKVDGSLTVLGNQTTTGFTTVNGGFDATGGAGLACNLPATTQINGIVVSTHGHISSSPGSRTSAGMIT